VGLALLVVTAALGGRLVFEHAAGVSNAHIIAEAQDRGIELPAAPVGATDSASAQPAHQHAPGTPPHEH